MKLLLCTVVLFMVVQDIVCPPVQPDIKPVEGMSPDDEEAPEDPAFGLEYERYLREVVMTLEEDDEFRKKLEEMNMTDIKNGKISRHLELVSHQIREKLDEIKRQEMDRLRMLAREKMKQMNGIQKADETYLHHVDVKNPHSFEPADLERLIKKATTDLDAIDKKRRGEFKTYEMEKEHERQEELRQLSDDERKVKEDEYEKLKAKHEDHPKLHHPGSKAQLEDVWEKTDHMDPEDFQPRTFFKMHDIDGNGFLDQNEVEALFQKELDQLYDPNMPEDDMRERYEDMARMREHVYTELDADKDRLISLEEFINYTNTEEFDKDEGWKGVDEEQNYTDEEFERYEAMLREHEARMRQHGMDPNIQPGMVPVGQDPNVQHMQMPQQGMGHPGQGYPQQGMHPGQGMPPPGVHPGQGMPPPGMHPGQGMHPDMQLSPQQQQQLLHQQQQMGQQQQMAQQQQFNQQQMNQAQVNQQQRLNQQAQLNQQGQLNQQQVNQQQLNQQQLNQQQLNQQAQQQVKQPEAQPQMKQNNMDTMPNAGAPPGGQPQGQMPGGQGQAPIQGGPPGGQGAQQQQAAGQGQQAGGQPVQGQGQAQGDTLKFQGHDAQKEEVKQPLV